MYSRTLQTNFICTPILCLLSHKQQDGKERDGQRLLTVD